jgi:hypothetical protein
VLARDGDSRRYDAQAWALTHLLMVGGDPVRRERFAAWLRHRGLQAGDAAFRSQFGADLDRVQAELHAYVARSALDYGMTPRGIVERKYVVTPASPIQVATALGHLDAVAR